MTGSELHVVFGYGQVGRPLAGLLRSAGHRIRVVKRTPVDAPEGIEIVTGDATDPAFCATAAAGAATVYHCMHAPYYAKVWARVVPVYLDNLIAAAGRADARLVVLDNLYAFGRPDGKPLHEETLYAPCSKKGEIRARAATRLFDAYRAGEARGLLAHASDFYGPGGTDSHLGDEFWPGVFAGRNGRLAVDPDAQHSYHYIPDVAAGLMALGTAERDVEGQPWMLPCPPAGTLRDILDRFEPLLGRPIELTVLSPRLMRVIGIVAPILRELAEMSYQWEEPFIVDDRRFRARFPFELTNPDRAAQATVEWARVHYAA